MTETEAPIRADQIQPGDRLITADKKVLVTAVSPVRDGVVRVWAGSPEPWRFDPDATVLAWTVVQERERRARIDAEYAERTAAIRRARGPWDRFIDAMAGVWR